MIQSFITIIFNITQTLEHHQKTASIEYPYKEEIMNKLQGNQISKQKFYKLFEL